MSRLAWIALTGVLAATGLAAKTADRPRADYPVAAARAQSDGEAIFLARCQYCHVEMGPGTITLGKRLGKDKALLAQRTDLTAPYIKGIVRHGFNTMPALTRPEVSDAELEEIAAYLTRSREAVAVKGK